MSESKTVAKLLAILQAGKITIDTLKCLLDDRYITFKQYLNILYAYELVVHTGYNYTPNFQPIFQPYCATHSTQQPVLTTSTTS